jgi:diguanylate cyclase (GGDEF)-like protein
VALTEPGSGKILASARFLRIFGVAVGAVLIWVIVIALLGLWRHEHVTQRHLTQATMDAKLMARANARILGQRFETLRTIAVMLSNQERLDRAAYGFNIMSSQTPNENWGDLLGNGELVILSQDFARMALELGIDGIFLTNSDGYVIAASDWGSDLTHLKESFGDAVHFRDAIETGVGEQFSVDTVNGQPRFFFSARVAQGAQIQGLVIIATSSERIVPLLRRGEEDVLLSDPFGIVVASNNKDWMYRAANGVDLGDMEVVDLGLRYGRSDFLPLPASAQAETANDVVEAGRIHAAVADDGFVSHVVVPVDNLVELRRANLIMMTGLVLFGVLLVAVAALVLAQIALIRERAIRDSLTGLYNRRYMDESLPGLIELDECGRLAGLALVAFDLDKFKGINDTWGHHVGDKVLRRFARVLVDCARRTDLPCRMGGDEFVVFLVEQDLDGASIFAERVRERVEAIEDIVPIPAGRITTSAGVVMRRPGEGLEDMVKRVDELLYRAKDNGHNRIEREDQISDAHPANATD